MMEKCKEAFLEEWKKSPFNHWWFTLLKWVGRKCFRAGWNMYMGMPVPYSVAKMLDRYDHDHVLHTWFSVGYIRGKWYIEGPPTCDCCNKPKVIVLKQREEENWGPEI